MTGLGKPGGSSRIFSANVVTPFNEDVSSMEDRFQSLLNLNQLTLDDGQLPQRPKYGEKGKQVAVWTNYVELKLNPDQVLNKYAVSIQPKAVGRKMHRIVELLVKEAPFKDIPYFTDFKATLILRQKVADQVFNIVYLAEDEDTPTPRSTVYHVRVQRTEELRVGQLLQSLDPTKGISLENKDAMVQALNTMLYHYSRSSNDRVAVGKKTFPLAGNSMMVGELGGGLQVIRGFFASVRPATGRVLVNVNVTYGAFYKPGPLVRLMIESGLQDKHKLDKFVTYLRVEKTHRRNVNKPGPMRSIVGLASPEDGRPPYGNSVQRPPKVTELGASAENVEFWFDKQKRYITVNEFFQSVLNIRLKNSKLPVVNVGSKEMPVYVPPELCEVPRGQHAPMRRVTLSGEQTTRMLNSAVRRPAENFKVIMDHGLQAAGLTSVNSLLLNPKFARVDPILLTAKARVLEETRVLYANREVKTRGAAWNLVGQKFSSPGEIKLWASLVVEVRGCSLAFPQPKSFEDVVSEFHKSMSVYGLKVPGCMGTRKLQLNGQDDGKLETTLKEASGKLQLLWIVIPPGMNLLYDRIKYLADVKLGFATVVSVDAKLAKSGLGQYLGNEALKVNLKLGGRNQVIHTSHQYFIADGATMIVGIDVTHPSTDLNKGGAPSVAAMVASVDKYLAQWRAVLSVQKKRQEMVSDLTGMLKSLLGLWKAHNGSYPRRILVYRDGVSEGQHRMVKDHELPMLQHACRAIYTPAMGLPQIAIIIVAKRNHTRFAPTKEMEADNTSNCRAGLAVDRTITEAREWNFFLQPHSAIKGSARPALYTVVHDEIFRAAAQTRNPKLNAADLCQDLTQSLCYAFGRATRAVGIPTPTYYADIVCTRATCYLRALDALETASDGGYSQAGGGGRSGEISPERRAQLQEAVETHGNLKDTMFYI